MKFESRFSYISYEFKCKITIRNMIENALKICIAFIVLIGGLIVGSVASIAEDVIWLATNSGIPDCDNQEDNYKKICKNLNQAYYTGKNMFFMLGTFGTIIPIYTFLAKNGFFSS